MGSLKLDSRLTLLQYKIERNAASPHVFRLAFAVSSHERIPDGFSHSGARRAAVGGTRVGRYGAASRVRFSDVSPRVRKTFITSRIRKTFIAARVGQACVASGIRKTSVSARVGQPVVFCVQHFRRCAMYA
jgi:hypothetical protein